VFCAVAACILLAGQASGAEEAVRRTDGLKVTFEPADARFADHLITLIQAARPQLMFTLGLDVPDTIHVHIAASIEEFQTYTPGAIPDWGEGYAVPDWRLIVLKSPRISGSLDNLTEVVTHELAHVLLHSAMRSADVPRWLDEGFAMHAAREWGLWDRAALVLAVWSDNLIPLSAIHSVNRFPERKAQLAYQESALAVGYILQQYGYDGLHALLDRLRATGSINQAFVDAFGITIVQFERDWHRYMELTYGWKALPGEGLSLLLGPAFLLFCVVAYFQMRRRRRKILAQWEREEAEEYGWTGEDDEWNRMKRRFTVIRDGQKEGQGGEGAEEEGSGDALPHRFQ
jgi:hypothetical protein